jgi:hypothetical protein
MRTALRISCACVLLYAVMCAPALAADSLSVFADNSVIELGGTTTLAAHADTDAAFGGGHVAMKYNGADQDCAADPGSDPGVDTVPPGIALAVQPGQGATDVGGQMIQLDVGNWRICGWLVDDHAGAVLAQASTVVRVVPYSGSVSIDVARRGPMFQLTLTYSTSSPARLYVSLQRATKACARNPERMPKGSILLVPAAGRFIGSDGGLGRAIDGRRLATGRWRVCGWLRADAGSVGPASKTFAVPARRRRGARGTG